MSYTLKTKEKAQALRAEGRSIIEIAKNLNIAKSTISIWVKNIKLPDSLQQFLENNTASGRAKGLAIIKAKRSLEKHNNRAEANANMASLPWQNKHLLKLCAALIYWCEGTKHPISTLCLTNSDPDLIKKFLHCLRNGFEIKEEKFRALIHLHDYHNEKIQLAFWSKISDIPLAQFHKSYLKKHTKIRKREGYQGCISIRYNDARVARKLEAIYHAFAQNPPRSFV